MWSTINVNTIYRYMDSLLFAQKKEVQGLGIVFVILILLLL